MTTGPPDLADTVGYLRSVVGDREAVDWFTDSTVGAGHVTGPMDVFLRTPAGEVTWGWSVGPVPVDPRERSFRRFRSEADELVMLVEASEPEMVFLPHETDLHSISRDGHTTHALTVPAGSLPESADAFDLDKRSRSDGGRYSIDPGWPTERVSAALQLWMASLAATDVAFRWVEATAEDVAAIDDLAGGDDAAADDTWTGLDEEIAEIVSEFASIAWIQSDLTWPDGDNVEAFRDRVDVQFRPPAGGLAYLASIHPIGNEDDPIRVELADGSVMYLDRTDPTSIGLLPDRTVLALNRQHDGYEPAGLAVPHGSPPSSDEWAELRRFRADHPDSILIHAVGWSETRIATGLSAWADWWGGADVEFAYDYEDPMPQTAITRNEALADAPAPADTFVRTATVDRCMHVPTDIAPNEDPFPCGRPATHYYTPAGSADGVVLVCEQHVPASGASPRLK